MANKRVLLVILAIALIFGMMVVGCGKGSKDGGSGVFTITGIPSTYNGKYAMLMGLGGSVIYGFQSNVGGNIKYSRISNGKVSIPLWKNKDGGVDIENVARYSGNDIALGLGVDIYDSEDGNGSKVTSVGFLLVKFSNGSATKAWKDGTTTN